MRRRRLPAVLLILTLLSCLADRDRSLDSVAVSFVAFGDWGTGGVGQWTVSLEVEDYCEDHECEFILSLGDNFYEEGITRSTENQWATKYAKMYHRLNLPFYALLGNHDMEGDHRLQIAYSRQDPLWRMPDEYYSIAFPEGSEAPDVQIFVINSENFTEEEEIWLQEALAGSWAAWKILAMHTPLISNGPHGDDFRGIGSRLLGLICGRVDLILSGHEHLFSHLRETIDGCSVEQLIIGTGGASLFDPDRTDPRVVSTGKFHGFGWFQASSLQLTFRMMREGEKKAYYETFWRKPFPPSSF